VAGGPVHLISGVSGAGVQEVLRALLSIIAEGRREAAPEEREWRP